MSAQNNGQSLTEQVSNAASNAYNSVADTVSGALGSDTGRKDLSTKAEEKATPDSSKSVIDQAGEAISGAYDKAARDLVPDSQKSAGQSVSDKASRVKDDLK